MTPLQAVAERLRAHVHRTPVHTSRRLDAWAGKQLFLKCENLQRTGSFKFRGALNAVLQLPESQRVVVADSSGNFGQALALAASSTGRRAIIVMPGDAPQVKQDAVRGYGGEVRLSDPSLAGRQAMRAQVVEETGGTYLPSSNHPDVIDGQATAGLELLEQVEGLDGIVAPVGGGGLVGGIALAAEGICPVYAAEPSGAADTWRSMKAGRLIPEHHPKTIAKGLLVNLGPETWEIIQGRVEEVVLVDDDQIVEAMRQVWLNTKLIIEPSAAVAVAAARLIDRQRLGVVLSGGNVDLGDLPFTSGSSSVP